MWALRNLTHESAELRKEAAGKLMLLGRTGDVALDSQILSSLLGRLSDVPDVAATSIDALASCAWRGDPAAAGYLLKTLT